MAHPYHDLHLYRPGLAAVPAPIAVDSTATSTATALDASCYYECLLTVPGYWILTSTEAAVGSTSEYATADDWSRSFRAKEGDAVRAILPNGGGTVGELHLRRLGII